MFDCIYKKKKKNRLILLVDGRLVMVFLDRASEGRLPFQLLSRPGCSIFYISMYGHIFEQAL